LAKLILTYQRYKIFFTYEDFSNYFYNAYNNKIINDDNYPLINHFVSKLDKINYTTFNKIYEIFKSESFELQKELNNEIVDFVDIYKMYGKNPKIHNYLDKQFSNHQNHINETITYLKRITEEIEINTLFIEFKKIIINTIDNKYFKTLLHFLNFTNSDSSFNFEGINFIDEIVQKNPEYLNRLTEIIYNLIMDKFNIKYNDLNNENYTEYINQIKNKISPQHSKSFYFKLQYDKIYSKNNNLIINNNSESLIEDSSDEESSHYSTEEINNL
jgi:hypothetical protein